MRMWRLKIGERGSDPYIFSTNNFVGRHTWVFDGEDNGNQEERDEVEVARRNFTSNRSRFRTCGDFIWRIQVSFFFIIYTCTLCVFVLVPLICFGHIFVDRNRSKFIFCKLLRTSHDLHSICCCSLNKSSMEDVLSLFKYKLVVYKCMLGLYFFHLNLN